MKRRCDSLQRVRNPRSLPNTKWRGCRITKWCSEISGDSYNLRLTVCVIQIFIVNLLFGGLKLMIGKRLKLARAATGLSLRDLAARIDNLVSAQAISKYEQDEMMPSSDVLIALASALGVKEEYLLGEPEMVLEGVEFRRKQDMSAKDQARVEANVLHLVERYLAVEEILALPVEWDEPRGAPYPVTQDIGEADRAAHILREHWG